MKIDIKQLAFIDSKLRIILLDIEKITGLEFTITSLYRIKDTGLHGRLPIRATDLRMRNKAVGKEIESLINDKWVYDPQRYANQRTGISCALLHGKGLNLHLHIQTHKNTRLR